MIEIISKTVVDKSATRAAKNPVEVEFSETSQSTVAATTLGNSISNFVPLWILHSINTSISNSRERR
jgi:hypothetical protein